MDEPGSSSTQPPAAADEPDSMEHDDLEQLEGVEHHEVVESEELERDDEEDLLDLNDAPRLDSDDEDEEESEESDVDDEEELTDERFVQDCLDPLLPLNEVGGRSSDSTSAMEPSRAAMNIIGSAIHSHGSSDGLEQYVDDPNEGHIIRPILGDFKTGHLYANHKYTYDPWYDRATNLLKQEPDTEIMHSVVLDYLITEGYGEVADALCEEAGIIFPTEEADSLEQRMAIRSAIIDEGDIEKAITMINSLAPNLVDQENDLKLKLDQQQIIELIRNGNIEQALDIGGRTMQNANQMSDDFLQEMERTFALMAFEDPLNCQFGKLMEMEHRHLVSNFVNTAVLKALNRQSISRLESCFKLMVHLNYQIHMNANPHGCAALLIQTTGGTREDHELTLAEKMFTNTDQD